MASSCKSLGAGSGLFHDWSSPLLLHEPVYLDMVAIVRYTDIRVENPISGKEICIMSVSVMSEWMATVPQDEVKSRYGLEAHEWAGSLSDRVMAIINKDAPNKEHQVNCFLRDQVAVFETGMERLEAERAEYDAMASHGFTFSYDLCRAIGEAVESGVLINPETMNAIKRVERSYVIPYGGESLTRQYDHLRELNDARKYHRETVPSLVSSHAEMKPGLSRLVAQEIADFLLITGGSAHGKEQVRLAHALEQWTRSTGRDTDGQPVSSPTPSQGSRQGSIAAVLPGSSITVGRQTPRVRSMSVPHTSAPQKSESHEADDGFEL